MATDLAVAPVLHPPAGGDETANKPDNSANIDAFWRQLGRIPAVFGAIAGLHFALWAGLTFGECSHVYRLKPVDLM